jgi:hypothetical protein
VGKGPNETAFPSFREVLQYAGKYSKSSSILEESRLSVNGKRVSKEREETQNSKIILYKSRTMSSSHWIGATEEVNTRFNLLLSQS